jgi:PP-loop superfamily ATP-utilizing enzyme
MKGIIIIIFRVMGGNFLAQSSFDIGIDEKYRLLIGFISSLGKAAVAFSGGVDRSFLCHATVAALGKNALAVTIVSPMLPKT